jgi:uncharacterized protein
MTITHHQINYVEFAAEQLDVFEAFYAAVFGWSFQRWGDDYMSFSGSGIEGGVRVESPNPGTTLVIILSDDLDATEKSVVAAGGKILERHEFPGGKRFHFQDPTGNRLAVWATCE